MFSLTMDKFVIALVCSAHLCHAGLVGWDESSAAPDLDSALANFLFAYAPPSVPRSIAKADRMAFHGGRTPVHRMMAEGRDDDSMFRKTDASRRAALIGGLTTSLLLPVGIAQAYDQIPDVWVKEKPKAKPRAENPAKVAKPTPQKVEKSGEATYAKPVPTKATATVAKPVPTKATATPKPAPKAPAISAPTAMELPKISAPAMEVPSFGVPNLDFDITQVGAGVAALAAAGLLSRAGSGNSNTFSVPSAPAPKKAPLYKYSKQEDMPDFIQESGVQLLGLLAAVPLLIGAPLLPILEPSLLPPSSAPVVAQQKKAPAPAAPKKVETKAVEPEAKKPAPEVKTPAAQAPAPEVKKVEPAPPKLAPEVKAPVAEKKTAEKAATEKAAAEAAEKKTAEKAKVEKAAMEKAAAEKAAAEKAAMEKAAAEKAAAEKAAVEKAKAEKAAMEKATAEKAAAEKAAPQKPTPAAKQVETKEAAPSVPAGELSNDDALAILSAYRSKKSR